MFRLWTGLLLLILGTSLSVASFEYCNGTSWVKFKDNCYLFQRNYDNKVSYYDAEDFCRSQGSHLASIHSEEENDFIIDALQKGWFGGRHWIGLNALAGDDNFQWSDGSSVDFLKKIPKEYSFNDKCFIMFVSRKGWRPEHCALHNPPLCKREANTPPTPLPPPTTVAPPTGYCPEGWIQFDQKCFKYFGTSEADKKKYDEARDACWRLGKDYDLVSIHSLQEQAFLTQHLYNFGSSAWIGMMKISSDEVGHDIVFGWTDNSRTDFTNWARGHPPPGTWKYCTYLDYDGVAKGKWIADYCAVAKRGYICQRPSDPSLPPPVPEPSRCKPGSVAYRNSCYSFFDKVDTQEKAEETCRDFGGHLVSVVDGFEQAFLMNFLAGKSGHIGIGLKNVEHTLYFGWPDKQPLYYTNWAQDQPHMDASAESCVSMDASNELKWKATNCNVRLPFVCKNTTGIPPAFPRVLGKCPGDGPWIDIGDNSCYHIAEADNHVQTWDATSRYCISRGMQMLRINSQHQTNSLIAYMWDEARYIHLGMIRSADKKTFMWLDGTPVNYTNWEGGKPSSWQDNADCVSFSPSTGQWQPVKCSDFAVAACRVDKSKK